MTAIGLLRAAEGNERWTTASIDSARIAVPKSWRVVDGIEESMPLFRQGDGRDVPVVDETGAPLQIGLTVEKFAPDDESTEAIAIDITKGAANDPQLTQIGPGSRETLKLHDQTTGTLVTSEFFKGSSRRSLYFKLIAKDDAKHVWVVTGYLVGGRQSEWTKPGSVLGRWMRAHVVSLTVRTKEIDRKAVDAAYAERDSKSAGDR